MVKKPNRILAIIMTALMLIMMLPLPVSAQTHENQVHVVVQNLTYTKDNGALWEGKKVDKWITIDSSSTALSVLASAVGTKNLNVVNSSYGTFINGIYGINSGDGGTVDEYGYNMAGWMFEINGTMADNGLSYYTAASRTLTSGDEFVFEYSLDGGKDIGYDWSVTDKKALKGLDVNVGVLSPEFQPQQTSYSLTVPEETDYIVLSPTPENKNEIINIFVGDTEYKRTQDIPVKTGTNITIKCSNGTDETTYTVYVKKASHISASEMTDNMLKLYQSKDKASICIYGREWDIMTMARADKLSKDWADAYYDNIKETVIATGSEKLDEFYATTNARVALALSSINKDPENVEGYNLLAPLADMNYITDQGVNAAIYALLAFDAKQYTIPTAKAGEIQTTRDGLKQNIYDAQLAGGGWAWSGTDADPDFTAMAIQALTPYYSTDSKAKSAIDRGLQALSDIQDPDGGFSSWSTKNSCSTAQVLLALSGMGIDPAKDSRFIKNGYNIITSLSDFYIAGNGFRYKTDDSSADPYSTSQAVQALVAYSRFTSGKTSFYNMKDLISGSITNNSTNTTETKPISQPSNPNAPSGAKPTDTQSSDTQFSGTQPADTESSTTNINAVKTGDSQPVALYITILVISLAIGCIILVSIKKQQDEQHKEQ